MFDVMTSTNEVGALERELRHARELLSIVPAYAALVAPDGRIISASGSAVEALAADTPPRIGAFVWDCAWWLALPASAERVRDAVARASAGRASEFDVQCSAPTGDPCWLRMKVTPLYAAGKTPSHIGVTGVDITEGRSQRAALQEAALISQTRSKANAKTIEAKEQFVSFLSHDLRSPIAAIMMGAAFLAERLVAPLERKFIDRIHEAAIHADRMIQHLLEARRIGADSPLRLQFRDGDMAVVARRVLWSVTEQHGDRFALSCPDVVQGHWDTAAVERAIENLCSNAIKYGSVDEPVQLSVIADENSVEIHVTNHGEPISQSDQHRLFLPFYRRDAASSGQQKGWGLGLTYVFQVATLHDGSVDVVSNRTHGTRFLIRLPRDLRTLIHVQKDAVQ